MLFVLKINVIVLHHFKYIGSFSATKYIRKYITWKENNFTLPGGFHGCSSKLQLGASRQGSALHKPTH